MRERSSKSGKSYLRMHADELREAADRLRERVKRERDRWKRDPRLRRRSLDFVALLREIEQTKSEAPARTAVAQVVLRLCNLMLEIAKTERRAYLFDADLKAHQNIRQVRRSAPAVLKTSEAIA